MICTYNLNLVFLLIFPTQRDQPLQNVLSLLLPLPLSSHKFSRACTEYLDNVLYILQIFICLKSIFKLNYINEKKNSFIILFPFVN